EAMDLALRMMEAPGARPAVGATEDRGVAVLLAHAVELARDQLERGVPGHLDEGLAPAARATARDLPATMRLQPAGSHRRPPHPRARAQRIEHAEADRRRIRVLGQAPHGPGRAAGRGRLDLVGAPMGPDEAPLLEWRAHGLRPLP